MAIEKTEFTGNSASHRAEELANWLTTNGTEYVTEITKYTDENKNEWIVCKTADENVELWFDTTAKRNNQIHFANGTIYLTNYLQSYKEMISTAVKTNYGIYLSNGIKAQGKSTILTMSKDNLGKILIHAEFGERYQHCFMSPARSKRFSIGYNDDLKNAVAQADMTVFSPIVIAQGIFTENMFFTPFSEYKGTVCTLTDSDGNKYFYDGYCAIKE